VLEDDHEAAPGDSARARDANGNWVVVGLMTHPAVRQRNQP